MKKNVYIIMVQHTENGKAYPECPVESGDGIVGFVTREDAQAAVDRLNMPSPWNEQFGIDSYYRIAPIVIWETSKARGEIDWEIMDMIVDDLREQGR